MNVNVDHLQKLLVLSPVPAILVGILLLTLGRKLFWLFVAVIGFIVGADVAGTMFPQASGWILVGGLILGLVGAMMALFVQKIAISVGGFVAGGYFLMMVLQAWGLLPPGYSWIAYLVGGFVGTILMTYLFNWTLIIFSSIAGAHLIVHAFPFNPSMSSSIFVGLLVVGCSVQGRVLTARTTHEV